MGQPSGWQLASNIALAIVLLITIGLGVWRAGGQGDGDPSRFAAMAPETRTMPAEGTPPATPETLRMPTAADCTVAPLTVDDVIRYIDDPGAVIRGDADTLATGDVPSTPGVDPLVSSPVANVAPGPASPAQLARMAEVQWQWMACVLANSPFQRWALESPELVASEVEPMFPNFVTENEARTILAEVQRTGVIEPHEDFWKKPNATFHTITGQGFPYGMDRTKENPTGQVLALIDQNPANSITADGRTFTVGYIVYIPSGTALHSSEPELSTDPADIYEDQNQLFNSCFAFEMTWYPERDWLLVSDFPSCG
jgi:hypothetical protein